MASRHASVPLLVLLIPLTGASSQDNTAPPNAATVRGYPTPQAVYNAHREAFRKRDYRTYFECLTPEAQRVCLFETVFASGMAGPKTSAAVKAISEKYMQGDLQKALDERYRKKYGIDRAKAREQRAKNPAIKLPNDTELLIELLAEHISDHVGFFSEMNAVILADDDEPPLGDLHNVVISANTATGQAEAQISHIESTGVGPEKTVTRKFQETIRFRRTNAGWLLDVKQ